MIRCNKCGNRLDLDGQQCAVATISGSIMGDEITESFFYCQACGQYMLEIWRERFCGEDSIRTEGPFSKAEGDAKIVLIRQCPQPWDKKCRCEAHRVYFDGWLD